MKHIPPTRPGRHNQTVSYPEATERPGFCYCRTHERLAYFSAGPWSEPRAMPMISRQNTVSPKISRVPRYKTSRNSDDNHAMDIWIHRHVAIEGPMDCRAWFSLDAMSYALQSSLRCEDAEQEAGPYAPAIPRDTPESNINGPGHLHIHSPFCVAGPVFPNPETGAPSIDAR